MRYIAGAAAAAIALAALSSAASAAVVTDTISVTQSSNPAFLGDINVTLPAFDASLGTLTGETLTFAGNFAPAENWIANDANSQQTPAVPVTLGVKVGIFAHQLTALPDQATNAVFGLFPYGGYTAYGRDEAFTVSAVMPSGSLGQADPGFDVWAETWPVSTIPGYSLGADLGTLNASLAVAFTYTPGHHHHRVPEPATLALLAVGLVGIGSAGAFRKARGDRPM